MPCQLEAILVIGRLVSRKGAKVTQRRKGKPISLRLCVTFAPLREIQPPLYGGLLSESQLLSVHQRLHYANSTNDGTGSALASFLLGLPAVKQRQEGIPQMQLRQWYADAFVQDSFQLTGQPVFDDNSRNADRWFNTAAFATPRRSRSATPAGTLFMGQVDRRWTSRCNASLR